MGHQMKLCYAESPIRKVEAPEQPEANRHKRRERPVTVPRGLVADAETLSPAQVPVTAPPRSRERAVEY